MRMLLSTPPSVSGPEPCRTIYGPAWSAARRALAVPPHGAAEEHAALRALATRIEVGWVFVRPVLLYAQENRDDHAGDPVFSFAAETAEFFRGMAELCFAWISDPASRDADTDSMLTELERLATYVAVLELAVRGSAETPLVSAVLQLAKEVPAWCAATSAIVSTLGDLWDSPDLGDGETA